MYKISYTSEESSCVSDLILDYDNGVVCVTYRSSVDRVYWYDCDHSEVLDCLEEASNTLGENVSIGKILNHYKKSGELKLI